MITPNCRSRHKQSKKLDPLAYISTEYFVFLTACLDEKKMAVSDLSQAVSREETQAKIQ